ncbi:hypothetical protein BpHYR1_050818 [Brachionus plicatilis]|uniref:Uncharacterized protein n=1 Tax=Brachionus plicatilis TaxID=10195 RepID=A0A3M7T855_BRAPC|nr:hypothetical protein BpHYR1_050818 [Brachionus plicatilis]
MKKQNLAFNSSYFKTSTDVLNRNDYPPSLHKSKNFQHKNNLTYKNTTLHNNSFRLTIDFKLKPVLNLFIEKDAKIKNFCSIEVLFIVSKSFEIRETRIVKIILKNVNVLMKNPALQYKVTIVETISIYNLISEIIIVINFIELLKGDVNTNFFN